LTRHRRPDLRPRRGTVRGAREENTVPAPPNLPDDFVSEDDLRDLGIDPELVRVLCPHATEYSGLDGKRCWARADLAPLLDGGEE
jgi:hypothetical protein